MGGFNLFRCFGKPKFDNTPQILMLKAKRDELDQYKDSLEARLHNFSDLCLKYLKENDKQKALFVLKRKALVSKQLTIIEEYSLMILGLISETEIAITEADVLQKLEIGNKLLAEINKELARKDLDSYFAEDKTNLDQIEKSLGVIKRNFEIDDLELVQELDLLTSDLNSSLQDPLYNLQTPKDQYHFNLDLTKLKSSSNSSSIAPTAYAAHTKLVK